jgi:hypothetical protein
VGFFGLVLVMSIGEKLCYAILELLALTVEGMNNMTDDEMKQSLLQKRTVEALKIFEENMMPTDKEIAEEFFFEYLIKNMQLGSIFFDSVGRIGLKSSRGIEEHYSIIMDSDDAIGIVEVEYKAHENDLDKLDRKMKNFKKLFPWFKDYRQYGAIASFHINETAKKAALSKGYFVLQRSGDVVHTENGEHLTVL